MHRSRHVWLPVLFAIVEVISLRAQLPFYTDDPSVTDRGKWHFEFFNEFDKLQSSQYPDLNQNTANFKLNYGLPHRLEADVDAPYLAIYHAASGGSTAAGPGDFDAGLKWNFRKTAPQSHIPGLAASLYVEAPTGNVQQQLGSGLADYWLNSIAQEPLTGKTRVTANFGFLFAGNTSTGVMSIDTKRGHVYTAGLSLLHDYTGRLTLGIEAYGGHRWAGPRPGFAMDFPDIRHAAP